MKPKGSEVAISVILAPFVFARRPLVDRLPQLDVEMTFMYGDYDWMESDTAAKLIQENKVKGKCFVVDEAGHHLYVENPAECVANLLQRTHGVEVCKLFKSKLA
jgi:cardiolipin-specific phospholipase